MTAPAVDPDFPCSLVIHIPFPTPRLASTAIRAMQVDEELSPLVTRSYSLVAATPDSSSTVQNDPFKASLLTNAAPISSVPAPDTTSVPGANDPLPGKDNETNTVLRVDYKATTNRMLRVAVNGFFESLGVVVQIMEELDVDVLHEKGIEGLEGVQGVEQGLTGMTASGA